jgi:hypothetical protein
MSLFNLIFGSSRGPGAKWACHCAKKSIANVWHSRKYWYSDTRLLALKNRHKGETCVIAGNGPSLRKTDFSLIKDLPAFGTNRIYLGMEELGFSPMYYVMVDSLMREQFWDEVKGLPMTKFVTHNGGGVRSPAETDAIFLRTRPLRGASVYFSTNPVEGICVGTSVVFSCLQLAFWMGFGRVLLIGVDHNYSREESKITEQENSEQGHFIKGYYPKGAKWVSHSEETVRFSELLYALSDHWFRGHGRAIVDCTVGGMCPVFCKSTLVAELEKNGE